MGRPNTSLANNKSASGNKSAEPRTKVRERVQRQDKEKEAPASKAEQSVNPLQRKPNLPRPSLPVADHTTLRPASVLPHPTITIQPKMEVNEPDDQFEVEADRVADQVMRMPSGDLSGWGRSAPTAPVLQLTPLVMRSEEAVAPAVTPTIERNIQALDGGGKPLDDDSRDFFEQRMGADFSDVRIHTDSNAVQTSRDINARAFTVGNNIAFNSGEFNPTTAAGKHLLAHELTHTIQQGAAHVQRMAEPVDEIATQIDPVEAEAMGQEALNTLGYDNLINLAYQHGLIQNDDNQRIQAKHITIARNTAGILGGYATAAGGAALADGPVPIGDLIGLGILAVGLIHVGVVWMSSHGNQADSGIMDEVHDLIQRGNAPDVCEALRILMEAAKQARDKARIRRIKKTQKAKGCRHSRHS